MSELFILTGGIILLPLSIGLMFEKTGQQILDWHSRIYHTRKERYRAEKYRIDGGLGSIIGLCCFISLLQR